MHAISTTQIRSSAATGLAPVLRGLSEESRRQLLRGGEHCRFAAGEDLADDERPAVGIVLTGVVRTYVQAADGRQQTVRYLQAGDVVGAGHLFGLQTDIHTEAATSVRWVRLQSTRVLTLMRVDATVAMALAAELAADHSAAVEQTRQAAFLGLRERLAHHLLLRASLDCGGLALTHRQMAGMVGSVREVVGRVVKQLESAGAIDRSSRGAVEVNVDAMRLLLTDVRQEQHAVNECVPRVS